MYIGNVGPLQLYYVSDTAGPRVDNRIRRNIA